MTMTQALAISEVDQLGNLKAQIAELQTKAKAIEASLKAGGVARTSGMFFDANVFEQTRTSVDWEAIAKKLEPSRQLVTAHTSESTSLVLKVTGRKVSA